jgi:hypothetical protein
VIGPVRICAWLLLPLLAIACGTSGKRVTADVMRTPEFQPDSLQTVAFIGLAAGSMGGEEALLVMEPLLETQLLAASAPFVVLPRDEVERRAALQGGRQTLKAVRDYWRDSKRVDKFEIAKLGAQLSVRAVLLGLIDEWGQISASQGSGEAAYTRVGASLTLYSVRTGRSIWRASASETLESESLGQDIEGSEQQTTQRRERQRSAGVQAVGRGPSAPSFEAVGEIVAGRLAGALLVQP